MTKILECDKFITSRKVKKCRAKGRAKNVDMSIFTIVMIFAITYLSLVIICGIAILMNIT